MFQFSMRKFMSDMVASGYSPDSIDATTYTGGDSWEVDFLHNTSPQKVFLQYDEIDNTYLVMYSVYLKDEDGIITILTSDTFTMEDDRWMDNTGGSVTPPKIVLDTFQALH